MKKNLLPIRSLMLCIFLLGSYSSMWSQANARSSATTITPGTTSFVTITGNLKTMTASAMTYYADPFSYETSASCTPSATTKDGWYQFVATSGSLNMQLSKGSSTAAAGYNISLQLFRKSTTGDSLLFDNNFYCPLISVSAYGEFSYGLDMNLSRLVKGATYYIRMVSNTTSTININYELLIKQAPATAANDDIDNATTLTIGSACTVASSPGTGSFSAGEGRATCVGNTGYLIESASLWYKFVAPASGLVSITSDTEDALGDVDKIRLALYQHNGGSMSNYANYSIIGCGAPDYSASDAFDKRGSLQSVKLTPGETYYIQVLTDYSWGDAFCISVKDLTTSLISSNTYCEGGSYTYTDYNYAEFDSVNKFKSWFMLRDGFDSESQIFAQVQNTTTGLNFNFINFKVGKVTSGATRTRADGRNYSFKYFSIDNYATGTSGAYDVFLYILESDMTAIGITADAFKVTQVPGSCVSSISAPLESSAVDITPSATGTNSAGTIRWIQFSTTSLGTFFITRNTPLSASLTSFENIHCAGENTGAAVVTATGGTSPYTYAWSGSSHTGSSISTLPLGLNVCTITDASGATDTVQVSIAEVNVLRLNSSMKTNVSCFGVSDGAIYLNIAGGISPYTYAWSTGGSTSSSITGLAAGTYTYTVTDAAGCELGGSIIITSPAVLSLTQTSTPVSCNGGNNGSIAVTPTGGTAPFTYAWTHGPISDTLTGLSAGSYTVTVTDANTCTFTDTFMITQPTDLAGTFTTSAITCHGADDGVVAIVASGGTAPYTYLWTSGSTATSISGLTPGTYSCTITDVNTCTATFTTIITAPSLITSSVDEYVCQGSMHPLGFYIVSDTTLSTTYTSINGCDSTVAVNYIPSSQGVAHTASTAPIYTEQVANTAFVNDDNCDALAMITSTADLGNIEAAVDFMTTTSSDSVIFVSRVYDIKVTNNHPATVTLYYTQSEIDSFNSTVGMEHPIYSAIGSAGENMMITAFHDTIIDGSMATVAEAIACTPMWNATEDRWEVTFYTSGFSTFFLHTSIKGDPLSIDFIEINAHAANHQSYIDWSIAQHPDAKSFSIERINERNQFESIGTLTLADPEQTKFTFIDTKPLSGMNYYRIAYIDPSQAVKYSPTVKVNHNHHLNQEVRIFPNPTTDQINIQLPKSVSNATIHLVDVSGKIIYTTVTEHSATTLSLQDYPNGVYMLNCTADGFHYSYKIIKQ